MDITKTDFTSHGAGTFSGQGNVGKSAIRLESIADKVSLGEEREMMTGKNPHLPSAQVKTDGASEQAGLSRLLKKLTAGFMATAALGMGLAGVACSGGFGPTSANAPPETQIERDISETNPQDQYKIELIKDVVQRTAEDLKKLDNSPEEYLVDQGGMLVSGGKVDVLPTEGSVEVGTPFQVTRSRSVSGTMKYDKETGELQFLHADVFENVRGKTEQRHVEFDRDRGFDRFQVTTQGRCGEVRIDHGRGEVTYTETEAPVS